MTNERPWTLVAELAEALVAKLVKLDERIMKLEQEKKDQIGAR